MASLDNVCLGIRKSVFRGYKFTAEYAENLELGMRLIKDGHSLIFQVSNAVIHSHSRSALYFLRRSYIDTASIRDLFSVPRGSLRTESALEASSYVYARLKMAISVLSADKGGAMYSAEGLRTLADTLCNNIDIFRPEWHSIPGNPMLDDYFERFEPTLHPDAVASQCDHIGALLKSFSVVSCNYVTDMETWKLTFMRAFIKCSALLPALISGSYFGRIRIAARRNIMRILLGVHQFFPRHYTGTERYVLNLAKQLQRMGHYVKVLTYAFREEGTVNSEHDAAVISREYAYEGVPVLALRHSIHPDDLTFVFDFFDDDVYEECPENLPQGAL